MANTNYVISAYKGNGVTMFKEDPRFETPEDTAKVWRYMAYDKFRRLVEEKCLHFCSVKTLNNTDPHEGSYYGCKLLNEISLSDAKDVAQKANRCGPPIAVNCWHLNDFESMAMWDLYSDSDGIAVQTTIKKLKEAFNKVQDSIRLGKIVYTDEAIEHPTGWTVDRFMACMTKKQCYAHEKEVRALIWNTSEIIREEDGSVKLPIEIKSLLENIVLSPKSEESLREKVLALLKKHDISINPQISPILTGPEF